MKAYTLCLLVVSGVAWSQTLFASKQGPLPISGFVLKSEGDRSSGAITITGERAGDKLIKLVISAFGKSIIVSEEQLKEINSSTTGVFSNIGIGFEPGYPDTDGRVVYINFGTGDPSISFNLCRVTISENGSISIKSAIKK